MIPQDKIIEWAREVDFYVDGNMRVGWADYDCTEELTAFAHLVAQYQKEEDADIVSAPHWKPSVRTELAKRAAAIRSQE